MRRFVFFWILALACVLAGCAGEGGGAPRAVEAYYQAISSRDSSQLVNHTCADFEQQARVEYDSFEGVIPTLEDFSCRQSGSEGESALVTCTGRIVASYGNEMLEFPLDNRTHRVVREGGDWYVCGY